jgi:hypothetical protein
LAGHAGSITQAASQFWADRYALYRQDGMPIFSEQVHIERMSAARSAFDNTVASALAAADAISNSAEVTLEALSTGDLIDELAPHERAAARDKAQFIEQDAARLPVRALAARMRSVAQDGDRASAYLWSRYGGQRLDDVMRSAAGTRQAPSTPVSEREELGALVTKLRGVVLGTQGQERLTEAREAIAKSKSLRKVALTQSFDVHGTFNETKERLRASNPRYRA